MRRYRFIGVFAWGKQEVGSQQEIRRTDNCQRQTEFC